jgi:hypothetical protein
MPTFVLLPELQQDFLAIAGRSLPDESEKSDEIAFLVERMPAVQWAFVPDLGVPASWPGSIQEMTPCYQKIIWCREPEQGSLRHRAIPISCSCSISTTNRNCRPVPWKLLNIK